MKRMIQAVPLRGFVCLILSPEIRIFTGFKHWFAARIEFYEFFCDNRSHNIL